MKPRYRVPVPAALTNLDEATPHSNRGKRSPHASSRQKRWAAIRSSIVLTVLAATLGCATERVSARIEFVVARTIAEAALLSSLAPQEFSDCPVDRDAPLTEFPRVVGEKSQVWTDSSSALVLDAAPVELLLTPHPSTIDRHVIVVRARFEDAVQERLLAFRARYEPCRILVSVESLPSWLETNRSDWSGAIPIGVFSASSSEYATLIAASAETRWVDWPELDAALDVTERSQQRALERYACDPEFREFFEAENPLAKELLKDLAGQFDCQDQIK